MRVELHEAMSQISEIRQQIVRTTVFRGYRSAPIAFSGLVALGAAYAQGVLIPEPTAAVGAYLKLWIGAAAVSLLAAGAEMGHRAWRAGSPLSRELTLLAVEQFLPCVAAGAMLTTVILLSAPDQIWMLPGLWGVVYGLGVFASYRLLPSAVFWVGAYYLFAGGACLAFAQGRFALAPWTMALTFGVGQLLAAGVLYWNLERGDELPG